MVRNVELQDVDVSGRGGNVSGLAASNRGRIANSSATGSVSGCNNVGLLAADNYGSIANSRVTGSVSGCSYVGLLAGHVYSGSIVNSHAAGTVSGGNYVGGLAGKHGFLNGLISHSSAAGTVSGGNYVGGLVGQIHLETKVRFSYSTASVTGTGNGGNYMGGLAGRNAGTISNSYATGKVSGKADNTGGLVGYNHTQGRIIGSYASGSVSSSGRNIGGLAGSNHGPIKTSYATGLVSGGSYMGGMAGKPASTDGTCGLVVEGRVRSCGGVQDSYWDTQTTGQAASYAGTGKSTAELQTPTGYTGIYARWNLDLDNNGSPDNAWDFGSSNDYPVLKSDLFEASPPGAVNLFAHLATGVSFTATADLTTDTAADLSLETLTTPSGASLSPSFQSSVYEYTLTVPTTMELLAFTGRFDSLADRSQRTAFGLLAVGTPDELDEAIDSRSGRPAGTVFAANSDAAARTRVIAMPPPSSTTTVEIRVYKKLAGRMDEWPLGTSTNSVVKTYTLTVEREALGEDNATLKDMRISAGTLKFYPDIDRLRGGRAGHRGQRDRHAHRAAPPGHHHRERHRPGHAGDSGLR